MKKDDDFAESCRNMTETPSSSSNIGSSGLSNCDSYNHMIKGKGIMCEEEAPEEDICTRHYIMYENVITFDLREQCVTYGMKILKAHLLFGAYGRTVQVFRVIMLESELKQLVVNLLETENIEWKEETRDILLIKLTGQTEFGFLKTLVVTLSNGAILNLLLDKKFGWLLKVGCYFLFFLK